MFEKIQAAPPDAILGLTEAFRNDPNPAKINLGVGVYKDDEGRTPVLASVVEAERRLLESSDTKSYLPIPGSPVYGRLVREMLFGADSDRACTAHTPGGTGALRVGADLLRRVRPEASVWLSTPSWANHKGIFEAAGFSVKNYPYYDPRTRGIDRPAMLEALSRIPAGDIVLLHVCCHNPTGVDPDEGLWGELAESGARQGWFPFFDFAYQGFGDDLVRDRAPLERFLASGMEFMVASSFSKNFGLYQERTGALTAVAADAGRAETVFSQMKAVIRVNYSNPPAHGGRIVETVLADEALRRRWEGELGAMRDRIRSMRRALAEGLRSRGVSQDFSFIERQRGMFSFSGLSPEQVDFLRTEKSIYIVGGGRINVAGITTANIDYLCDGIAEALSR